MRRLNAICPYYTMFPLEFPLGALQTAKRGDRVVDPFAGRGTTLYAARLLGLQSVGVDSNPVAAAASSAKLVTIRPESIVNCAKELAAANDDAAVPDGPFWRLAYHPTTLQTVCRIRTGLRDRHDPPAVALRGLMLGLLHGPVRMGAPSYLSNQMPRTYATKPGAAVRFWTERRLKPSRVDVIDLVERKARWFFGELPPAIRGTVVCGDAADVLRRRWAPFNWVITSPPYFGMRTYRPDQWLRNWFVGGPETVDYTEVSQLGGSSLTNFMSALTEIWATTASKCVPGARLVVRFGALPSLQSDTPKSLLVQTLNDSGAWRVIRTREVAGASRGRRQAAQFGISAAAGPEVDCYAVARG